MKTERHADGLWHIILPGATLACCGRPREPQKQGRPGKPTCEACVELADGVTRPLLPAELVAGPPVRPDGLCSVCLSPRKPERSRRYAGIQAELDPFCSSACARHWHGNPLPAKSIWGEPRNEAAA